MTDDNADNPQTPKQALLGELQSIKDLLDDSSLDDLDDQLLDIPILDDVVPELSNNSSASDLLDLDNIFDDDLLDKSPTPQQLTSNEPPAEQSTGYYLHTSDDAIDIEFPSFTLNTTPGTKPEDATSALSQSRHEASQPAPEAYSDAPAANSKLEQQPPENTATKACDSELDIELLVQELVDELIPTIESKLRERLSQSSQAVILALANKYLEQ